MLRGQCSPADPAGSSGQTFPFLQSLRLQYEPLDLMLIHCSYRNHDFALTTSAPVSRTVAVVVMRRSILCSPSCPYVALYIAHLCFVDCYVT